MLVKESKEDERTSCSRSVCSTFSPNTKLEKEEGEKGGEERSEE